MPVVSCFSATTLAEDETKLMTTIATRRHFTIRDYARMREAGILNEDDRVELIDGEIYVMSPLGPRHVALLIRLNKLLVGAVQNEAVISPQNSIQLDDYTEPQPDLAVLHPQEDDYEAQLPQPDDIFFLIEIVDTTAEYDREVKLPRYATSRIAEVWVVDVNEQTVEQYTQVFEGNYTSVKKHFRGMTIQSTTVPRIRLNINQIFKKP
jgi:Uma2 family endonuclease